jgi:hypothetical protein
MNRNKELSKEVSPSMISSIIDNSNSSRNISRTGKCLRRKRKQKMNTIKNLGSNGKLNITSLETQ